LNAERQEEERRIMASIERRLEEEPRCAEAYCVVLDDEGWHRGVIGITASRVVERHGRPTLVISRDGDEAHGSGRSIHHFICCMPSNRAPNCFRATAATRTRWVLRCQRQYRKAARASGWLRARPAHSRRFRTATGVRSRAAAWRSHARPYQALLCSNPLAWRIGEPVFAARGVRLMAPPAAVKDKHVRLRVAPALNSAAPDFTPPAIPTQRPFRNEMVRLSKTHPHGATTFCSRPWAGE